MVCFVVFRASGSGGFGFCRDLGPDIIRVVVFIMVIMDGVFVIVLLSVVCFLRWWWVTGINTEVAEA